MKQEFASSASSLPHMGSQHTTAGQTARSGGFQPGMSSIKAQIMAEMQAPPQEVEGDRLLDIESKVQMFKITVDKINKSKQKKMQN